MIVDRIQANFTVNIPQEYQKQFTVGQEIAIVYDERGRLVIVPLEHVRTTLLGVFGMWADRHDQPDDGVAYMDEVRQGSRLVELEMDAHESH